MNCKILHIYENDYGCEERDDDSVLQCIVEYIDENGIVTEIVVPDRVLRELGLDEGSTFQLDNFNNFLKLI